MGFNIGIDYNDLNITAYCMETGNMLSLPAVIARDKKEDIWMIGEDAYRAALSGTGVLTDRLITLFRKGGTSTVSRRPYTAAALIAMLFKRVLGELTGEEDTAEAVGELVICLTEAERELFLLMRDAALGAGIDPGRIRIISREEAFIHYMMSADPSLTHQMAGLFNLSQDDISFFSLRVLRGSGRRGAVAESKKIEEKFRLGILKNGQGSQLGDTLLRDAASKCMGSDVYSSILLTGSGFERTDWAKNFLGFVCPRRRVIYEAGLFAMGAAYYAAGRDTDYLVFCDTRLSFEVSVGVSVMGRDHKLIMISQGDPWFQEDIYAELMPAGQKYIDIHIDPVEKGKPSRTKRISLKSFPERPDKCTRVSLRIGSESGKRLKVRVTDLGFGDFYPASGLYTEDYIKL